MRFIFVFALTSAFLASALYGLILAVDPYNKFGYNLFNLETKAVDFARENKFNQVEHSKKDYTAFITGSSSAHRYMTKELNRLSGLKFYNYSTQSATPEDYMAMTRHFLKHNKVKMIILSIDFEVLNKNTKTDEMFFSSPLKDYLKEMPAEEMEVDLFNNSYFTLAAIQDSVKVIWVNLFGKAQHAYLEDGDHVRSKRPEVLRVTQFHAAKYIFDERRIGYLKTIRDLCEQQKIKLLVLTSPLSKEHIERIFSDPVLKTNHERFKQKLVEIFGEVFDFQNTGMFPYDSTEYFNDSNHPNHDFSTKVMERVLVGPDPSNPEFGKLLKQ